MHELSHHLKNEHRIANNRSGRGVDAGKLENELSRLKNEHRIAKNRISVLESDLALMQAERTKSDELSAALVHGFSLWTKSNIAHANGTFPFRLASPNFASLCQTPGISATVQIGWSAGVNAMLPSSRELVVGCPREREGLPLVAKLPAVAGRYSLCLRLELFNVVENDLNRSYSHFVPPHVNATNTQQRTYDFHPCTSLSVYVGRTIGCVNVTVPSLAAENVSAIQLSGRRSGEIAGTTCSHTTSEVQGRWSDAYQVDKPAHFELACRRPKPPAAASAKPPGLWVHLIGDSVATGMLGGHIATALYGGPRRQLYAGERPLHLLIRGNKAHDSLPQYGCLNRTRLRSTPLGVHCFTTSRWFDIGMSSNGLPADQAADPEVYERLRGLGYGGRPRPDIVLISLGLHHRDVWGGDDSSRSRFLYMFGKFIRHMHRLGTRGFVLVTESAKETAFTPSRYASVENMCQLSNVRTQLRNRAMAESFLRACSDIEGASICRILDLFSPTVALVGAPAGRNFRDRDPVHFWKDKPSYSTQTDRSRSSAEVSCAFCA